MSNKKKINTTKNKKLAKTNAMQQGGAKNEEVVNKQSVNLESDKAEVFNDIDTLDIQEVESGRIESVGVDLSQIPEQETMEDNRKKVKPQKKTKTD
ncbi:MAG: hypothetical protein ACI4PF_05045, partial [Christensenellales bacterium]